MWNIGINFVVFKPQPRAVVIHTIDLIYVIFYTHPNLFEEICVSDMNMVHNHFLCFCNRILQTLLDISFYIYLFICFKDNRINVNIPNFCPPIWYIPSLSVIFMNRWISKAKTKVVSRLK